MSKDSELIYKMKLHDTTKVTHDKVTMYITRVAGGWLYTYWGDPELGPVFVPFNNEFMNDKEEE